MASNVKGEFTKLSGKVIFDPQNLASSSVEAVIDTARLSTREPQRDTHLKSPDFFEVAKFPTLTFKSGQIYRAGAQLVIKGDMTMRGVTKEIVLTVDGPTPELKDPWGNLRSVRRPARTSTGKTGGLTGTRRSKPEGSWWATK